VNDVTDTEMHTAEPLGPESGLLGVEKLRTTEVLRVNTISAELIQAEGNILHSEIFPSVYKKGKKLTLCECCYFYKRLVCVWLCIIYIGILAPPPTFVCCGLWVAVSLISHLDFF
jgi:hypothetical protein